MSNCKSFDYPGWGEWARKNMSYTQAIRVGDRIHCSGQGGWVAQSTEIDFDNFIKPDLADEIEQAFANVEYNLQYAGGAGWKQVYKVVTYSTDIRAQHELIVANLRRWMPEHCAVWTELGVKQLGADAMHIEIDVEAYDPDGARRVG